MGNREPEHLTRVELVPTHARAAQILTDMCEYEAADAANEAESLVGYWFENYDPREGGDPQPVGKLRELSSMAQHCAVSLIAGRFYPHYGVKVYVDDTGTFWADQDLFC